MKEKKQIAYFSMEFGLSEKLPIYSGGLGVLAGDLLKAAKDQKRDLIGVGIFWKQGYVVQKVIDASVQKSWIPSPQDKIKKLAMQVEVEIDQIKVNLDTYEVKGLGNSKLYLLSSEGTELSQKLYQGDRVAQEIILGVGGVRLLRALGKNPDLFHFNEGHALFAGFELIREKISEKGLSLEEAIIETRKEVVFTTHTPIAAGNEVHGIDYILGKGAGLGVLNYQDLEKMGGSPLSMTQAALFLSKKANGVSKLHQSTARKLWHHCPEGLRILGITNGVHMKTWQDKRMTTLAKNKDLSELGKVHQTLKKKLFSFIKKSLNQKLDPNCLTLGFARRATAYKRASLIFQDKSWIEGLLEQKKIQLIFAGKNHPEDLGGKTEVEFILKLSEKYPQHIIFLENYNMDLGKLLTQGVDVWLNNPKRPLEASGTSGMKAGANGVLNLSTLDGWWEEACEHGKNGWQFGDGLEIENEEASLENDLTALKKCLENEVIPTYYDQQKNWQQMMLNSIESVSKNFSADRMLNDYFEVLYR